MTFSKLFLSLSLVFAAACGGGQRVEVFHDMGNSVCDAPTDYACPNGNCPDKTACNWCGCGSAWSSTGHWSCNQRACNFDGGAGQCATDSDCNSGHVCRFVGTCDGDRRGRCTSPTENFYPSSCVFSSPQPTRACLCDGTQKEILVDCSGVFEPFRNLGDCE